MNTTAKRGRKPKPFRTSDGTYVNGLRYRGGNRYEITDGPKKGTTFNASNQADALERRAKLTGADTAEVIERLTPTQLHWSLSQAKRWARDFILNTPQLAAKELEIEWLAYGETLTPPEPPPPLSELEAAWETHSKVTPAEKRLVLKAWRDFVATTGIVGINDIKPKVVVSFRDTVYARGLMGKTQAHLFNRTRRMLTFAQSRAIAPEALTVALNNLKLLKPSESTVANNPKPIDPSDFRKLIDTAEGDTKAMLLLMLNAALYIKEAIDSQWSDIQGDCLLSRRKKKGVCVRVATLWPETLEALKAVKRRGDHIFYGKHGARLTESGAGKRFRKLRTSAEVTVEVTASLMRDGALTAAAAANVTEQLCKLYAGHSCGIDDRYVLRNPKMVAPACEAVYRHYFSA